ncbi:hypothetical protein DLEV_190 [Diachasmimorpha longicaudata entomopoxvirus]|uniref:Uncharacterized protein n=1 Tax=Diachasmimorpha longicaudata entomopoxvirus TaxID=109981 RepID=A0A7R5WF04_9POXV|nr:hypothetical protein QKK69_gp004 [Diachasmimorpha longicaudata entomopoxvirus]YP_010796937.1 hypothetical protein QKK69_gp190 [Diachasmimorpha longicaudata entomopoxvirus]AKS26295.1 hypothetical protein DLEV_004 [Diachasmimorpha longicaudata entomopoxvirus]AKS26481.1 hypothetical protein DLEV_190 [Diachasmimorpha longicaudata entomopoxvirus]
MYLSNLLGLLFLSGLSYNLEPPSDQFIILDYSNPNISEDIECIDFIIQHHLKLPQRLNIRKKIKLITNTEYDMAKALLSNDCFTPEDVCNYEYPGCFQDQPFLEKIRIITDTIHCQVFNILTLGYVVRKC